VTRPYQRAGSIPSRVRPASCGAAVHLEDKKLEIIGWKDPKNAMKAIKDSANSFSKDDK
jgi:hypothetical protein